MNANKHLLNRQGQIGLVVLVVSMAAAVFSGGIVAFVSLLWAIVGFYVLEHQDISLKGFFSLERKKGKSR